MKPAAPGLERTRLRRRIDALDRRIVRLLADRQELTDAMAAFKTKDAVRDEARMSEVLARLRVQAEALDLPVDLVEVIWSRLMEISARRQERLLEERKVAPVAWGSGRERTG
jgi:chorismate mutase